MTTIKRLRPEGLVSSKFFSQVAVIPPNAKTIYVGGQNAVDINGTLVGENNIAAQSAYALHNVSLALKAVGATLNDVIQWTVLIVEGENIEDAYGAIAADIASEEPPLVTVARVAGLAIPGALIEISAIAAIM